MLGALKEYNDLCVKPGIEWAKKHWIGYSVFVIISFLAPAIIVKIMEAVEQSQFEKVFNKDKEDEAE